MTLRDKIMDKYWAEFLKSEDFMDCPRRYEYATPLEARFWYWFKVNYAENLPPKALEDYLK